MADWLTVLAPGLMRRIGAFFFMRLSPRSRVRQAIMARVSCSVYDAMSRGDFELLLATMDPEVELVAPGIGPPDMDEVYRGHDGVMRFVEAWMGQWDDYRFEIDELIDAGGRRDVTLVTVLREGGRGKGSGVEIETRRVQVITLRDALAVRVQTFNDLGEALATTGICDAAS